jgi:hypothetical protein
LLEGKKMPEGKPDSRRSDAYLYDSEISFSPSNFSLMEKFFS